MDCSACGAPQAPGARFCASCGARVDPPVFHDRASRPPEGVLCPRCGARTAPVPYFSRGVNIAKAVALAIPFTFVGPVLFFFWRKDTFICTGCRRMLPFEAPVGLLEAFSPTTTALPPEGYETALALRTQPEGALAIARGRASSAASTLMGVVSGGFATIGAFAASVGEEAAAPLFVVSLVSGSMAVLTGWRGRVRARHAEAARRRTQTLEVIDLAREHGGRLNVTLVAGRMRLDFAEAERLLDGMIDGRRVDMQVDGDGRVTYVFPELLP